MKSFLGKVQISVFDQKQWTIINIIYSMVSIKVVSFVCV